MIIDSKASDTRLYVYIHRSEGLKVKMYCDALPPMQQKESSSLTFQFLSLFVYFESRVNVICF